MLGWGLIKKFYFQGGYLSGGGGGAFDDLWYIDTLFVFRFTLTLWAYVSEPCRYDFCEILSHRDSLNFLTPVLLLTKGGMLASVLNMQLSV